MTTLDQLSGLPAHWKQRRIDALQDDLHRSSLSAPPPESTKEEVAVRSLFRGSRRDRDGTGNRVRRACARARNDSTR